MAKVHTHRLRPKGAEHWQHVTAEELKTITAQVGAYTLKTNYQVEPMAEKPEALPTTKKEATPKEAAPAK